MRGRVGFVAGGLQGQASGGCTPVEGNTINGQQDETSAVLEPHAPPPTVFESPVMRLFSALSLTYNYVTPVAILPADS